MSASESFEASKTAETKPAPRIAGTDGTTWRSGPLIGLVFALVSGVLVWIVVWNFHPVFTNEKDANAMGILPPEKQWELDRNNSIFILALLGGLASAGLAIAEGLCRKSWTTALAGGTACAAAGAVIGGLAGYLGLITFNYFQSRADLAELDKTIRVYAVMLPMLGAGVGLGTGIFLGRRLRTTVNCLIGGALAGLLAAICYPVIVAMLIPGAVTKVLIPVGVKEQLVWFGITPGLLGIIIPSVAAKRSEKRSAIHESQVASN